MSRLFLLCWMCSLLKISTAQFPRLDSARQSVYNANSKKEQLKALMELSGFKNAMPGDSIRHFALITRQLAQELNDRRAMAHAEYQLLSGDVAAGKTDSVISAIDKNPYFVDIKKSDAYLYYKIHLLKANVLNRTNRLPEALDLQLRLLREAESENNTLARLFLLNYTGATYLNSVGNREEARKTWYSALEIIGEKSEGQYVEIEAYVLSNLALYYIGNYYSHPTPALYDTCQDLLNRTVIRCRESETMGVLASVLYLRGGWYGFQKKYPEAEKDFRDALEIRNRIGDPLYISGDMKNLALFYLQQNEPKKALAAATEGLNVATRHNIRETALELMWLQANAHKASGDMANYAGILEKILVMADSISKQNSADKIADLRTRYEVQKKENLIAQQEFDLFKRKMYLYAGAALVLLLTVFLIYRFRKYQQGHRLLIERKRVQSEQAIKEAEDKERNRIASELHDNLGVQANAILHNSNMLANESGYSTPVVSRLQETAKEMLLNLRETLWALKSADTNAIELWLRIIGFMQMMGRQYTGLRFVVEGKAPKQLMIQASRALHVVLVIQETVNNSVKHARADTIVAQCMEENGQWIIVIRDNGQGFNTADAYHKTDSYGLLNMQERAKDGQFNYELHSIPGEGTVTTIKIQLA